MESNMEPKQELLDGECTQTCVNFYDASFDVCEEELYDSRLKSEILNEKIVDIRRSITDLSYKQQCAEPQSNEDISESVNSKSSNYLDYSLRHIKLEPVLKYGLRPTDIFQTSGSSAVASSLVNSIQGNKTSTELGEVNTSDNFEVEMDLKNQLDSPEAQKASLLKGKKCNRDRNYEKIGMFPKKGNFSKRNKNEMTEEKNELLEKQTNVIQASIRTQDISRNNRAKCKSLFAEKNLRKTFSCDICNKKFGLKNSLKYHMVTHTGEKPFSCELCNFICGLKGSLVRHIKTHTGEKPFACLLCSYKCGRKSGLVNHMRTHTGEKRFSCNHCNYKCNEKNHLVNHMRTHTGEKPFCCELCNSKFAQKNNLDSHMRTHNGKKPYSCGLCYFNFNRKDYLVNHMRTHTGEKPFICKLCNFKCARKSNLDNHMRTHIGMMLYSCDLCSFKCGRKSGLVNHMRTHSGQKPFS